MMNIRFTPQAKDDLDNIWLYIAQDSPQRATELIYKIKSCCDLLSENPKIGKERDDLINGLRQLPVKNRIVFYRVQESTIDVVRILHGSRDVKRVF